MTGDPGLEAVNSGSVPSRPGGRAIDGAAGGETDRTASGGMFRATTAEEAAA